MKDGPWNDLMNALKTSYKHLASQINLKGIVSCSVIIYDDCVKQTIPPAEPSVNDIANINFYGGGTEFDPPLFEIEKMISANINTFDKFRVVFMSDGEASHPTESLKKIKSHGDILRLTKFNFVAFGQTNSSIFTKIAKEVNGTTTSAVDLGQLTRSFVEIISRGDFK